MLYLKLHHMLLWLHTNCRFSTDIFEMQTLSSVFLPSIFVLLNRCMNFQIHRLLPSKNRQDYGTCPFRVIICSNALKNKGSIFCVLTTVPCEITFSQLADSSQFFFLSVVSLLVGRIVITVYDYNDLP